MPKATWERRRFVGLLGTGITLGATGNRLGGAGSNRVAADSSGLNTGESRAAADWPMSGRDAANTGYNPDATPPKEGVSLGWQNPLANVAMTPVVTEDTIYSQDYGGNFVTADVETGELDRLERDWDRSTSPTVLDGIMYHAVSSHLFDDVLYASEIDSGDTRWEVEFDEPIQLSPTVAGGVVYVGTTDHLYAFDAADGSEYWSVGLEDTIDQDIAVVDGTVYAGIGRPTATITNGGRVFALDADTGETRWERDVGANFSTSPVVVDDQLFVATDTDEFDRYLVSALDVETGETRWEFETLTEVATPPATDGDTVYVPLGETYQGRSIVALDGETGEEQWLIDVRGDVTTQPAIARETLYTATDDGMVFAVDTASGELRWSGTFALEDSPAVVVAGERVIVAGDALVVLEPGNDTSIEARGTGLPTEWVYENGGGFGTDYVAGGADSVYLGNGRTVFVIDPATGESVTALIRDSDQLFGSIADQPVVTGGLLYAATAGTVYAMDDETGVVRWVFDVEGSVSGTPAVAGNTVYVGADDGTIHVVDVETGAERRQLEIGHDITASPAVAGNTVYVTGQTDTSISRLYALDVETGETRWEEHATRASVPTVVDGIVYVGGRGGLRALDATTGEEYWSVDADSSVRAQPVVADGMVYAVTEAHNDLSDQRGGTVFAVDAATGETAWAVRTGVSIRTPPVVIGGTVYVGNHHGTIFAIDAATGEVIEWTHLSDPVSSLATVDETIFVAFDERSRLHALDGSNSVTDPLDRPGLTSTERTAHSSTNESDDSSDDSSTANPEGDSDDSSTDRAMPGFGIIGTLTALGGVPLYRHLTREFDEESDR